MGFSDFQMRALSRSVPKQHVRSRVREGKELSYVEGWYVLAQANRIFGFDGWDRETVETKCIMGREARGTFAAVYSARVRIIVHADDRTIIRDGHGTGEAIGQSIGEVHDRALKAAETDATKRALATFGKAFGLALYAGVKPGIPLQQGNGKERHEASAPSIPQEVGPTCERSAPDAQPPLPEPNGADLPSPNHAKPAIAASASPSTAPAVTSVRQGIDKSTLPLPEPHRVRDKEHLRFVASQPCLLCSATPSDAHHVRFAQPRAMGRKVGDDFTVPLCRVPPSRTPRQRQRSGLVARHGHRPDRNRRRALEREPSGADQRSSATAAVTGARLSE